MFSRMFLCTSCCLFLCMVFKQAQSFDVVVDLPSKFTFNKNDSAVLTTFRGSEQETFDVNMSVTCADSTYRWDPIQIQFSLFPTSMVESKRIKLLINSKPEGLRVNSATDVMFDVIVDVAVTSSINGNSWRQQKFIPVVKMKGHIFIQTDRALYKPNDEVFVRFIPVDEMLKPLAHPMEMSIMAPNPRPGGLPLVSWTKRKAAANEVFVRYFKLPDMPPIGQWIITAKFYREDIVDTLFSKAFHVEDVTIPTFDLTIRPITESFILSEHQELSFEITAKFAYGESLHGSAAIRIGLFNPLWRKNPLIITQVMSNQLIQRGRLVVPVRVANVTSGYNFSTLIESETRLFVEATAVEIGGVHTRSTRHTDIIFTSSPIRIKLDQSQSHYKPGLRYTVQADVFYPNGSAAAHIPLTVIANGYLTNSPLRRVYNGDVYASDTGKLMEYFETPSNLSSIKVIVRVQQNFQGIRFYAEASKTIFPQASNHGEYMQIVPPLGRYPIGGMALLEVLLQVGSLPKTIIYTVSSVRGYNTEGTIEAGSNTNRVTISIPVLSEMSPLSHISVYYVTHTATGLPFIVADSTSVLVEESCQGRGLEVYLPETRVPYPGDAIDMEVRGNPNAYVGLNGVDQNVLSLGEDYDGNGDTAALSRKNMFDLLKSNTPGCANHATPFPESAFPSVGRILATSVLHNFAAASHVSCSKPSSRDTRRRKRSISGNKMGQLSLLRSASGFLGYQFECCVIGASNISSVVTYDGETCQKRAETVAVDEECKRRFLECCQEAKGEQTTAQLRKSSFKKSSIITVMHPEMPYFSPFQSTLESVELTRNNFARTWFNTDFNLGNTGRKHLDNESDPSVPRLPGSITSWIINGFSLSQDHGLCIMDENTLSVEHSLFLQVGLPEETIRGTLFSVEVTIYNYLPYWVTANITLEAKKGLCTGTSTKVVHRSIPASTSEVATIEKVRFNVIPTEAGTTSVAVRMDAVYNNNLHSRVDQVAKEIHVIPEGMPKRRVEWILVDNRHSNKKRSPISEMKIQLSLPVPPNSIPGSEKARLKVHSATSAFLQEPQIPAEESATMSQYLYKLQSIISRLEVLKNALTLFEKDDLYEEAQMAYTGLLRYAREVKDETLSDDTEILYGFSFSPAQTAKPDLWLTCTTLKTVCLISELVEIDPDEKILTGSLRWILFHQNKGKNAYFAANPIVKKRRFRTSRGTSLKSRAKPIHSTRRTKNPQGSTTQKRSDSASRLDKKIYRTAVVSTLLSSVLRSTKRLGKDSTRRHPEAFNAINSYNLRDSLRRAMRYVAVNINKTRRSTATPLTIAAAARALFFLSGKPFNLLEESLNNFRQENEDGNLWWIENGVESDIGEPPEIQSMKTISTKIEATAYTLHYKAFSHIPNVDQYTRNFANWLLKQRDVNNRWGSLMSSLASMEAIQSYLQYSEAFAVQQSLMRIEPMSGSSPSTPPLTPFGGQPNNEMEISTESREMNITMSGVGQSWVEFEMKYNMPEGDDPSNPGNFMESDPMACPFDVLVSVNTAAVSTAFFVNFRSLTSSVVLQIDIQIRYKSWYDPLEHGGSSYVVDFGLHSNYKPVLNDLEKLCNPVEKVIDYYLISQKGLLLFFSGERNISFQITQSRTDGLVLPIPYSVYPAAFPERRCHGYYSPPGVRHQVLTLCSNSEESRRTGSDVCLCVTSASCPKLTNRGKSVKTTTQTRINLTCKSSTKFAYRVRLQRKESQGRDWWVFRGLVRHVYKGPGGMESGINVNASFWVKKTCDIQRISTNKDYFLTGRSVVQAENGIFKHLLDASARFEQWPGRRNNCNRFSGQTLTICRKLDDYSYKMQTRGCGGSY